jgi:hypothetical protein
MKNCLRSYASLRYESNLLLVHLDSSSYAIFIGEIAYLEFQKKSSIIIGLKN